MCWLVEFIIREIGSGWKRSERSAYIKLRYLQKVPFSFEWKTRVVIVKISEVDDSR